MLSFFLALLAAQPWPVADQPDLKSRLDGAPALAVEALGVPARSVTNYAPRLVPNPDGKTWDVLQWYYKDYSGPTWLYAIDLGTGAVKKQRFPDRRQIHIAGQTLAPDGKYYIATPDWGRWERGGGGMNLFVYDPATNTLEDRGIIVPDLVGERRDLVAGPDGLIYGTGNYLNARKAGAYSYDPKTRRVVKNYGPIGPSHAPNGAFGYSLGVDDTHIYVASGKIPWYLVAIEIKTGTEKVLLEAPPGDNMTVAERFPGAVATLRLSPDAEPKSYWLYHGQATPAVGSPPWKAARSSIDPGREAPEIYTGETYPDAQGRARLWFRSPGETEWRSISLEGIETYPLPLHRLIQMPDGRIFGRAAGYLGNFLFDPRTGASTPLGDGGGSPYAYVVHEGKVYWSGYPSGPVYVYDPARPWTLEKNGPPGQAAPAEDSLASNPRLLGRLFPATRVKKVQSAAVAAGRIWFGGIGQRDYTGGGLGWLDPKTGELGGVWRPFSGYKIYWVTPALDERYLVISTKTTQDELNGNRRPEAAKIFIYDVRASSLVREITPVPKAEKAGPVLEVAPGRLLGTTEDPEVKGGGLLYGVDVQTSEVLFRKKVPYALPFPWTEGTRQWDFRKGPDGFVWTVMGNTVVRVDPRDARVDAVGKLDPLGKFTFAGEDLYIPGAEQLRRVRGLLRRR